MKGIIVKGIAGFYYVKTDSGIHQCKARGIFKKDGIVPTVGDEVRICLHEDSDATIDEIFERKNCFIRPPIANVDCLVVVIAATNPDPSRAIIDRFLVMAEKSHTEIVLCVNKIDLAQEERLQRLRGIYEDIYPMVFVSCKRGDGIEDLKNLLAGKKAALTGPSGVGKSTLLNTMQPELLQQTGELSRKTNRGKQTTRHVEIFDMEFGGMVFDTPGFTSFDILEAEEAELQHLYPEMLPFLGKCRYDNCRHLSEPGCAVRANVEAGIIGKTRYASYREQLEEIIEKNKTRY